jgi:hypothetical protein
MSITLRNAGIALSLAVLAGTIPAIAQTPGGATQGTTPSAGATQGTKTPRAAGPAIVGSWNGQLTQINSQTPIKVELVISAKGAETKYPDIDCIGKLIRSGASKSYVFFIEVITKGRVDKGGRCPDGTITVARQGTILPWGGSATSKIALWLDMALSQRSNSTEPME